MGAFKLGNMTFGSLFKKPETVRYPLEKKPQPIGLKGHILIDVNNCILCGMCDRSCPTDCITVDKAEGFWQVDRFACIQCGYCVTVCPKNCLFMHPDYAQASTIHTFEKYLVPKQEKVAAKAKEQKADPEPAPAAAKAQEPETGLGVDSEPELAENAVDAELEAKIAGMDPEKAQRVRDALAAR